MKLCCKCFILSLIRHRSCFIKGVAQGLAYLPHVVVIRYYFSRRLGFASGVSYAGIGFGLLALPPVTAWLCREYGWRGALLIHSGFNANLILCGALYRPSRLEQQILKKHSDSETSEHKSGSHNQIRVTVSENDKCACSRLCQQVDDSFALSSLFRNRLYVIFSIVTIFTMWGFISTTVFLVPKLVLDLGMSIRTASLVMTAYGISNTLARLLHGLLLDYDVISVTNLNLLSIVLCGINPLMSPLVTSIEGQFILAIVFGVGGGIMASMIAPVCRQYVQINMVPNGVGLTYAISAVGMLMGTQLMGKCDLYKTSAQNQKGVKGEGNPDFCAIVLIKSDITITLI